MGRFCLRSPQLNPLSGKAQQLPIINPFDRHGRVFFASWMSFMISFFAWYAFPPLLARTIRADLRLTPEQVLNSNIVALIAGFLMRVGVGPLCDQFGPRRVMTGILVCAAIPCGMAGLIRNVAGLYAIRFFVGLAGATFVPAMAWCSSWYDRNAVGTANGFAAGWGNAGAGVTYFVMPAAFDSLVTNMDLTPHVAWRVAFIVPTIMLLSAAAFAFFLCEDLPTGKWSERHLIAGAIVDEPAAAPVASSSDSGSDIEVKTGASTPTPPAANPDKTSEKGRAAAMAAAQGQTISTEAYEAGIAPTRMEVVQKPTLRGTLPLLLAPQTVMLALPYACSFGGELAVNSILSSWYLKHFAHLGWTQTHAGRVAAIFGLLNVVTRPAGGFLADWIYGKMPAGRGLFAKKTWCESASSV
jgi:NNP family nitrate/nitrite transporter-like MFS transporter